MVINWTVLNRYRDNLDRNDKHCWTSEDYYWHISEREMIFFYSPVFLLPRGLFSPTALLWSSDRDNDFSRILFPADRAAPEWSWSGSGETEVGRRSRRSRRCCRSPNVGPAKKWKSNFHSYHSFWKSLNKETTNFIHFG